MASTLSQYLETALLEQITKRAAAPTISEVAVALCTTEPSSADTTLAGKEATFTGYKRFVLETGTGWEAAVAGSPSAIKSKVLAKFECSGGGGQKVKAVALCDNKTVESGHMLCWSSVTEFEVSPSATPVEFAAKAIEATLS